MSSFLLLLLLLLMLLLIRLLSWLGPSLRQSIVCIRIQLISIPTEMLYTDIQIPNTMKRIPKILQNRNRTEIIFSWILMISLVMLHISFISLLIACTLAATNIAHERHNSVTRHHVCSGSYQMASSKLPLLNLNKADLLLQFTFDRCSLNVGCKRTVQHCSCRSCHGLFEFSSTECEHLLGFFYPFPLYGGFSPSST